MLAQPPEDGIDQVAASDSNGGELANVIPLFRGIWAERVENNQALPVGGPLFSHGTTRELVLDFESFEVGADRFTQENLQTLFKQSEAEVIKWLTESGSSVDPYTFFVCYQAQLKVHALLAVDLKADTEGQREKMYMDNGHPTLSNLIGKTGCAERAALGQWLIQKSGLDSAYVSGITISDVNDSDEGAEDHSWIAVRDPAVASSYLIFDIARPRAAQGNPIPRVLQTEVVFNSDQLSRNPNAVFKGREVLQGGELYYGTGNPVAGGHNVV